MNRQTVDRLRWHLKITEKVQSGNEWEDYILSQSEVHPQYGSCKREWQRGSDEMYMDDKLEVELTFVGDDFDYIMYDNNGDLWPTNIKYILQLYYDNIYVKDVYFRKTTCEIDMNHKTIKVSFKEIGLFDKLNSGKDDEYDVKKLKDADGNLLSTKSAATSIPPMMQIYGCYTDKSTLVSRINSVNSVDTNASEYTPHEISTDMGCRMGLAVGFQIDSGSFAGHYIHTSWLGTASDDFSSGGYLHYCRNVDNTNQYFTLFINASDNSVNISLFDTDISLSAQYQSSTTIQTLTSAESIEVGALTVDHVMFRIYAFRVLIHDDATTDELSDSLYTSSIYNGYVPKAIVPYAVIGDGYGPFYVSETASAPSGNWQPMDEDAWQGDIRVYVKTDYLQGIAYDSSNSYYAIWTLISSIKDFYLLADVLKALLAKVDSDLTFSFDENHSQFLFSANNPITEATNDHYYITQKSNIFTVNADYGAWKAPITLSYVLEFLRNALNCYYDIYTDGNGNRHFRVEHKLFYMNGLSYDTYSRNTIDLTAYVDARNHRALSFNTNRWSYDTSDCPTKIEFSWMDDQSEAFTGEPITVPENRMMINTNYTEKRQISWFSADLDFLMLNQASSSNDGFLVVTATETTLLGNTILLIDSGTINYSGGSVFAFNYKLSMPYLQETYWIYGICGTYAMINGIEVEVANPPKMRTTELSFVLPYGETVGGNDVMVTEIGEGEVTEMTFDLTSGQVTCTCKFETE